MRLCEDTITVINGKLDREAGMDVYHATVIAGVSWFFNTVTTVDSSGLKAANQVTIRIPEGADASGKHYATPEAFAAGEPEQLFTLRPGDLVVHGRVEENLRPAELKERGYELATILAVTDNRRGRAPHWKVTGK